MDLHLRRERTKGAIVRACHAGLGSAELRRQVIDQLRAVVPFEAVCFPTADPATLMITGNVGEGLPPEAAPHFFRVEYAADDYNKFSDLARSRRRVRTLSEATAARFDLSARWREVFGPLGLNDDLRAAMVVDGGCWGYLALHREGRKGSFGREDVALVAELTGHLAEGLRTALLIEHAADRTDEGPGLLLLDERLEVVASTPAARSWLAEVGRGEREIGAVASPILAAAASLPALERDPSGSAPIPRARLRTAAGRWLAVHAARLDGAGVDDRRIAVILELARPAEIAPLIGAAYALTERERQVVQQVVVGRSTREIAQRLFISDNTVEDHLKAIFEKTGVHSRGELVAQLFAQQYLPRIRGGAKLGANGWFAGEVAPDD